MGIHSVERTAMPASGPDVRPGQFHLPAGWPVLAVLVLFPLWYVLGLGAFIWIILAVPMLVHLVVAKTWRVPRGFIIWVFFLVWVALSAIEISKSSNWLTYAYRAGGYLAATVAFIYLVNTGEKALPTRRIINALTVLWVVIVIGGFAAMAAPHLSFPTPTEKLLGHLGSNKLLLALIHPTLAQAQALGGVQAIGHAIARPAAPFAYTNWWGANFAFLVPFVILAIRQARTRLVRVSWLPWCPSSTPSIAGHGSASSSAVCTPGYGSPPGGADGPRLAGSPCSLCSRWRCSPRRWVVWSGPGWGMKGVRRFASRSSSSPGRMSWDLPWWATESRSRRPSASTRSRTLGPKDNCG
jgi:hypothetical protein